MANTTSRTTLADFRFHRRALALVVIGSLVAVVLNVSALVGLLQGRSWNSVSLLVVGGGFAGAMANLARGPWHWRSLRTWTHNGPGPRIAAVQWLLTGAGLIANSAMLLAFHYSAITWIVVGFALQVGAVLVPKSVGAIADHLSARAFRHRMSRRPH